MLQTVLEIGKAFRESDNNYKYHKYILPCPSDTDKRKILRLSIFIDNDFDFKTDDIEEITDENIIKNKLFYLKFKTSNADTTIRYVYGDIYYSVDKDGKEKGNYTIKKNDSFKQAEESIKDCSNEIILKFRKKFAEQKDKIEAIILKNINNEYSEIFLHFNFTYRVYKYWHKKEELEEINRLLINHFFKKQDKDKLVLDAMLVRTICSGNKKNDIQFPSFDIKSRYKTCFFSSEDAKNLFYAINYTEQPLIKIRKTDINIIVLPKGNNLSALAYDEFNKHTRTIEGDEEKQDEDKLAGSNEPSEELFAPLTEEKTAEKIVEFDLIFSERGDRTWVDMIELTGIEKSDLQRIHNRIIKIKHDILIKKNINILDSFNNILSYSSKSKKNQNHLCKVLPQIYTETYYSDPILLPALIEKTEYNIRNIKTDSERSGAFPKYDFYFLTLIQNNNKNKEGENLMKIKESESYNIGYLLGKLVLPFAKWREDCPIQSFEKSYVGNISRRIITLDELIKFKNFIDEKLTVHEKLYKDIKDISYGLAQKINDFSGKYNKDECSFGFFEAYFEPIQNKNNNKSEEN